MEQPMNLDKTAVFDRLSAITKELLEKLQARFELHPDPSTKDLQSYGNSDGSIKGLLHTFFGKDIDWLVQAQIDSLEKSNFGTMRLTTWLGSHIRVPHLAFEFGSVRNIFFYMDYIPRTDISIDLEYLERYYEPVNQTFLNLQADSRLSSFTSKSVYIRQFQSPISLCYTCPPTEDSVKLLRTLAHEMLDRWLSWIDEAEIVPENERPGLAERDLFLRRSSAERDPGNKGAALMFGAELTDKLVRALWGGDRLND